MPLISRTASLRLVPPCSVTTDRGTTTTLCGRSASLVPVLSDAAACSSGAVELALPPGPLPAARLALGAETTISGIGVPALGAGVDGAGAANGVPCGAGCVACGADGVTCSVDGAA